MWIDKFTLFVIAAGLWWEYCWVPAREQSRQDKWRREQAKRPPPMPEPYGPGWYEWLYRDDPAGMVAHKYRSYMSHRKWEERQDAHVGEFYEHRWRMLKQYGWSE